MSKKNSWQIGGFEGYAHVPVDDELVSIATDVATKVGGELTDWLEEQSGNGYKFAVMFNPERDVFVASLYGLHRDCPNGGFMLTSESDGLVIAIAGLIAKVLVLEGVLWSETAQTDKNRSPFR